MLFYWKSECLLLEECVFVTERVSVCYWKSECLLLED